MADIVLINPRFEVSYWGLEYTAEIMGKSASQPVNNLPLLAALTPAGHQVTILDENVAVLDYGRLSRADIVGITGMCVQWLQMRQILERLKDLNVFTVAGGAWASVKEDDFVDLTDVIFVGEADETWPRFIKEWENKQYHSRYEQDEKTDMTRLPTPRYDLIDMNKYLFANVQFSRGCPFNCEFCDIIVT
ncbi:MAG: B12-binding domain-containing radical SAM protein, partial [Gammaproteobacteria bacterium]|nr:B12-binding domain-containing radical SAM protein [Gammaproteobacteria bacterium]